MKIGLYSELARQDVVKIRNEIRELGIGSSDTEMRSFREMIISSKKDYHKRFLNFCGDFYSLSEVRDVLFHVQEHRFTVPRIKECLEKLELELCGLESPGIDSRFLKTNPLPDDQYNLDKWQEYEESNPSSFTGMYQFWCQKPD